MGSWRRCACGVFVEGIHHGCTVAWRDGDDRFGDDDEALGGYRVNDRFGDDDEALGGYRVNDRFGDDDEALGGYRVNDRFGDDDEALGGYRVKDQFGERSGMGVCRCPRCWSLALRMYRTPVSPRPGGAR